MAVSLDEFKRAFSRQRSVDPPGATEQQVAAVLKELKGSVDALEQAGAPPASFRAELVGLVSRFDGASKVAKKKSGSESIIGGWFDEIQREARAAVTNSKAYAEYCILMARAHINLGTLEGLPAEGRLPRQIKQIQADLKAAEKFAVASRFADAAERAQKIVADCRAAQAEASILSILSDQDRNGFYKNSDLKGLMQDFINPPGNADSLDGFILSLPDDMQQMVFAAALKTRFGIDVEVYQSAFLRDTDGELKLDELGRPTRIGITVWEDVPESTPNKSMKSIYKMLTKVPESHADAKQNTSLSRIRHFTEDDAGGFYEYGTHIAYLQLSRDFGEGKLNQSKEIASGRSHDGKAMFFPDELRKKGLELEDYRPINTHVETPRFEWVVLHEVGHSVDDMLKVMTSHMEDAQYGNWKLETLKSVAAAGAARFECDQAYVETRLSGADMPEEKLPQVFTNSNDGKQLKLTVDQWCADVTSGDIWMDAAKSKRVSTDDRVYQESVPGAWYSYPYAERGKGIHGYQFRAPGEWFAELYAACYCGKLKDTHPFVSILKDLENK